MPGRSGEATERAKMRQGGAGRRRGGDCVDVPAPSKPTVPSKEVSEPSEKVIGQIVRKPNGEIVLRFF